MMQSNVYNLEERSYLFAKKVRGFVKNIEKSISNKEDIKQLVRASGSVAANYIEVNENLGPRDILMKLKICKKESKEAILWLRLLDVEKVREDERQELIREATELKNILATIYRKISQKGEIKMSNPI